jgi:tRNA (guanine37-N1)-methyltransferase
VKIGVITLFPEMFAAVTEYGISGRAFRHELMALSAYNPRDFTLDKHRTVDAKPFGGGPGMLMKTEPLLAAIKASKQQLPTARVLYLSPQGRKLDNGAMQELARRPQIILVCGRYQGIDQRVIDAEIDEEWSLGDFVLSGGEIAAMALIDGMSRFQPGALGDAASASEDSFSDGLLHSPQYTRPAVFDGSQVPDELLGGNHEVIRVWRLKQSLGSTWLKRPDLLEQLTLTPEQATLLAEFKQEHA